MFNIFKQKSVQKWYYKGYAVETEATGCHAEYAGRKW